MTNADPKGEHVAVAAQILSAGVAAGRAVLEEAVQMGGNAPSIAAHQIDAEIARLEQGLAGARTHLEEHVRVFHSPPEENLQQIVAAHLLIFDDAAFISTITRRIREHGMSAEVAVEEAFGAAIERLLETDDAYLQARAEDLRDSSHLIQRGLAGQLETEEHEHAHAHDGHPIVFVTPHLRPSAVLRARRLGAVAFVTSGTANASHAAILLRASGIPALGGVDLGHAALVDGAPLLVDALDGTLHVHPPEAIVEEACSRGDEARRAIGDASRAGEPMAAVSADGVEVRLWANVDDPSRMELCARYRLHGVGLFRTEFFVLTDDKMPDEETQTHIYRDAIERLGDRPIVLRTFDIGAEKVTPGLHERRESNPALGLRGIRRHLHARTAELRSQLRAILRATYERDAAVLLPMVTHVGDIIATKRHLAEVTDELDREGKAYNHALKVAAMIEVPAAVLGLEEILAEVDFVCIGTNDLGQYMAAADRDNPDVSAYTDPDVSHLYDAIGWMARRAREQGRVDDILVGGELASDPVAAVRLVELGVRGLIVGPLAADAVRDAIAAATIGPSSSPA